MLPRFQEPPPPAADASRRKLLGLEADLKARAKARRPKPRRRTVNFHEISWAAPAAEDPT